MASNRFALLSSIDNPESTLANLLQKFVPADGVTDLLLLKRELTGNFQRFPK